MTEFPSSIFTPPFAYISKNIISNDDCKRLINLGTDNWGEGLTNNPEYNKIRKCEVAWSNEQWIYDLLWDHMIQVNNESGWGYQISAAQSVQITKYTKGGFYSWHIDGLGSHMEVWEEPDNVHLHGNTRKLSMSLILNNEFKGGNLQIRHTNRWDGDTDTVKVDKGRMIFFPSFMEHRVTPVKEGVRYSLVCWFVGKPFI